MSWCTSIVCLCAGMALAASSPAPPLPSSTSSSTDAVSNITLIVDSECACSLRYSFTKSRNAELTSIHGVSIVLPSTRCGRATIFVASAAPSASRASGVARRIICCTAAFTCKRERERERERERGAGA
jgi:hypothetical protein